MKRAAWGRGACRGRRGWAPGCGASTCEASAARRRVASTRVAARACSSRVWLVGRSVHEPRTRQACENEGEVVPPHLINIQDINCFTCMCQPPVSEAPPDDAAEVAAAMAMAMVMSAAVAPAAIAQRALGSGCKRRVPPARGADSVGRRRRGRARRDEEALAEVRAP
ncbi:Protein of unknown function [Gryllus bimaculatus]|nr:Protein of unknown function [Gryllus bimaculatus]